MQTISDHTGKFTLGNDRVSGGVASPEKPHLGVTAAENDAAFDRLVARVSRIPDSVALGEKVRDLSIVGVQLARMPNVSNWQVEVQASKIVAAVDAYLAAVERENAR